MVTRQEVFASLMRVRLRSIPPKGRHRCSGRARCVSLCGGEASPRRNRFSALSHESCSLARCRKGGHCCHNVCLSISPKGARPPPLDSPAPGCPRRPFARATAAALRCGFRPKASGQRRGCPPICPARLGCSLALRVRPLLKRGRSFECRLRCAEPMPGAAPA